MHGIFYPTALGRPVVGAFCRNFFKHSQIAHDFAPVFRVEFGVERRNQQAQHVDNLKGLVLIRRLRENFKLGNIFAVKRPDQFQLRRELVSKIFPVNSQRLVNRHVEIGCESLRGGVVFFAELLRRHAPFKTFAAQNIFYVARRNIRVDKKRKARDGEDNIGFLVEGRVFVHDEPAERRNKYAKRNYRRSFYV